MVDLNVILARFSSRAPQGARGLKYRKNTINSSLIRRAPQGARGLKFDIVYDRFAAPESRPARGAWVEIAIPAISDVKRLSSRPARGAWVEIQGAKGDTDTSAVAPRKGRVG